MINKVMNYCKNFFVYSCESDTYTIESDGIVGNLSETYIVGQYVSIDYSYVNDGVYKVLAVTDSKLTLDAELTEEDTGDTILIYGLKVPKAFDDIVDDISTYDSTVQYGIKSESQGNRSVSYGSGAGSGDNTWQSVYNNALKPYKRMISDKDTVKRSYDVNTKGWY